VQLDTDLPLRNSKSPHIDSAKTDKTGFRRFRHYATGHILRKNTNTSPEQFQSHFRILPKHRPGELPCSDIYSALSYYRLSQPQPKPPSPAWVMHAPLAPTNQATIASLSNPPKTKCSSRNLAVSAPQDFTLPVLTASELPALTERRYPGRMTGSVLLGGGSLVGIV
jgi:hypothetical protein